MKHLLTLAALLVSTLSLAQFTPYNPDADNDQFVGAQDLLAFLPLFGEDWDLDSLVVYNQVDLEQPAYCDDPLNAACPLQNWLQVPQDADIIIMDISGGIDVRLALPEIAKPLIVLNCDYASVEYGNYWYSETGEYVNVPTIYTSGWHPNAFIFLAFGGQYFQVKS